MAHIATLARGGGSKTDAAIKLNTAKVYTPINIEKPSAPVLLCRTAVQPHIEWTMSEPQAEDGF